MGLRFGLAKMIGATLTWGLRNVCHRPAANTPGKIALYADPALISDLAPRLRRGSVVVVGTNGKTTVTNLLADVVERSGQSVVCNRTGANLDSGVATALLQSRGADWGVFESDELWMAKILPHLRSNYVILLNLFRDQLDRCGEIDRIQDSIVATLGKSPKTVLVYNADDPLCAMIAERAAALPGREATPSIPFGVSESMGLAQNAVADATVCQRCSSMFEYAFRQYGQLGEYRCPNCGFERPSLEFSAEEVDLGARGLSFTVSDGRAGRRARGRATCAHRSAGPTWFTTCWRWRRRRGCSAARLTRSRQPSTRSIRRTAAFRITTSGAPRAAQPGEEPDGIQPEPEDRGAGRGPEGRGVFRERQGGRRARCLVDLGHRLRRACLSARLRRVRRGERRNDLQVRLKYAGIDARLIGGIDEVFAALAADAAMPSDAGVYAIANYTALPVVHAALNEAAKREAAKPGRGVRPRLRPARQMRGRRLRRPRRRRRRDARPPSAETAGPRALPPTTASLALVIAHMFPRLAEPLRRRRQRARARAAMPLARHPRRGTPRRARPGDRPFRRRPGVSRRRSRSRAEACLVAAHAHARRHRAVRRGRGRPSGHMRRIPDPRQDVASRG